MRRGEAPQRVERGGERRRHMPRLYLFRARRLLFMRILFGPEHDARHVDPDAPGAYEWWYFDALSDDGRYALVAIWFLGSPMTPYYKAVVDGRKPVARDWCGVFLSLHEAGRERAYAYNLYRGGDFAPDHPQVRVGDSFVASEGDGPLWKWHLNARERCLWLGSVRLDATITAAGPPLTLPPMGEKEDSADHTWVCVAPVCHADVRVTLANGCVVSFTGSGYHDHNFGRLPWIDTDIWYWGRARVADPAGDLRSAVFYRLEGPDAQHTDLLLVCDASGRVMDAGVYEGNRTYRDVEGEEWQNAFGLNLRQAVFMETPTNGYSLVAPFGVLRHHFRISPLSSGPFYVRSLVQPVALTARGNEAPSFRGPGIVEAFRPSRLCGPIASRAMWTRIRRRS